MRPKWGPLLSIYRHVAVYNLIKRNRLICEDVRVPRDKRKEIGSHRKSVLRNRAVFRAKTSRYRLKTFRLQLVKLRRQSKPSYATRIEHGRRERGPHLPPERFPPLFDALANAHLHLNNLDIERLRLDDDFERIFSSTRRYQIVSARYRRHQDPVQKSQ